MTSVQRVALVTGASSGIGKEAAKQLAADGWRVLAHGRDEKRLADAVADIAAVSSSATVEGFVADLCMMSETSAMAERIFAATDRIDLILANAGGVRDSQIITSEGNEATFAGNHLGHFLLTMRLLPLLQATAADQPAGRVRIINVSSRGHMACQSIDWDDLQGLENWTSIGAYGVAKLANILFARELSKRLACDGIVAHAVHPGVVASNFASHGTAELQAHMAAAESITPAQAARDLVWVGTSVDAGNSNGLYWSERQVQQPSALAMDNAAALRLWVESEALITRSLAAR